MIKDDFKKKLDQLKQTKTENKVQYRFQDLVLATIQELSLPRKLQTDPNKKPLDVVAMLMRQAKTSPALFKRRFALVKEKGLGGEEAIKYYMGIVESENKKK